MYIKVKNMEDEYTVIKRDSIVNASVVIRKIYRFDVDSYILFNVFNGTEKEEYKSIGLSAEIPDIIVKYGVNENDISELYNIALGVVLSNPKPYEDVIANIDVAVYMLLCENIESYLNMIGH